MKQRSYMTDTDEEREAFKKALDKWYESETQAKLAVIYATNDSVASALGNLITEIVRHNGSAKCYGQVAMVLTRDVFDLMDDSEDE